MIYILIYAKKTNINKIQNFICKNHNQLCCPTCISKIKNEYYGKHKDCEIFLIKDIKDEKRNQLKNNIKCLNDLSNNLENSINKIKKLLEEININKENLKIKIQKIFTSIRNKINEKEEQLLLELENKFDNIFINQDILNKSEKLPNKIKILLEKGNMIEKEWNENKLNSLINECISIENSIKEINIINGIIKKCNLNRKILIKFSPEEKGITKFIESIDNFGKIIYNKFSFKKCPINISEDKKYIVNDDKGNIVTKTCKNSFVSIVCEYELEEPKEYKWKIKILKNYADNILIGVAPNDIDITNSLYTNYGWYICTSSSLFSGPPNNYCGKESNLKVIKEEVIVVMDINKRTLKFIIDNIDKGESYNNIPIDKPLVPVIFLYNVNDSVEIIECQIIFVFLIYNIYNILLFHVF